jgi:Outer membrane protein beta-barrel family
MMLFMQKKILLLACMFLISFFAHSQTASIKGKLKDDAEKAPIYNAVVALLTPKDSFLYKFVRSDDKGYFEIKNIDTGKYILMTTHSRYGDYTDDINIKENENNIGELTLLSKSKLLEQVIVKTGSAIRIKGDTTIYTADSFKVSANANVEELLKKMPGIQVGKNGEIKAMGEKVEKVLVDGEEFFGDDPGMAVKNLRADAVKEVQVFDKKSDQAEFTGISDGATQKTINLKLKDDKKKGYFGKIDASAGPQKEIDDRYNTNLLLSSFKGKRKLSGFVLNGNTGQDGLSWEDRDKYTGGNDDYSVNMDDDGNVNYTWTGGNNDDEPYVSTENGFIKNTNTGIQYSNKWNDKQTLNLSPKYNNQIYNNSKKNFVQTQIGDTILNERGSTISNVNRDNFKTSGSYEIKLDSNNTIKFTGKANFYRTESNEYTSSATTGKNDFLKNNTSRTLETSSDKSSFFGGILLKHKFKKPRRTLSINSSWNLLNTSANSLLKSNNQNFVNGAPSSKIDLNQNRETDKKDQNISSNIVFTEAISKNHSLELSHQVSYSTGVNDQISYKYSSFTGKYDLVIDSLSNQFDQKIILNKPGIKINYSTKKIKYNFGSGFGFTHFDLADKSRNNNYVRNFTNFFPSASFTYNYKSNSNFRFNYNGSTSQPSINQLQPLRNNDNFYNQYIGNPDLKPSFSNSFSLSHNSYDFVKELSMYQSVRIRTVNNSFGTSRTVDIKNDSITKTITKPINTNGNFSVSFYGGTWFKIKKLKMDVGFNPNLSYNKMINEINGTAAISKTLNGGMSIYLSKSKEKKYDFSINNNFNHNRNSTSQNDRIQKFNTYSLDVDATIYYKKSWSLTTNYNIFVRQKTADFQDNLSNQLWNARLQHTFKNDEFTAYILVRDILNQNIGITRYLYDNMLTEETNTRLKRYAMIGFAWNFKNKGAAKK